MLCLTPQSHGLYNSWNSRGQNTGVGSLFPSPGAPPNSGIEPRSPALQADSLPAEPNFFGRNDAKTETPVLWPPHAKS